MHIHPYMIYTYKVYWFESFAVKPSWYKLLACSIFFCVLLSVPYLFFSIWCSNFESSLWKWFNRNEISEDSRQLEPKNTHSQIMMPDRRTRTHIINSKIKHCCNLIQISIFFSICIIFIMYIRDDWVPVYRVPQQMAISHEIFSRYCDYNMDSKLMHVCEWVCLSERGWARRDTQQKWFLRTIEKWYNSHESTIFISIALYLIQNYIYIS